MKLIIIESGDQLGKSSLLKGLCEHFNYDNVTIRHFGKPPKNLSPKEVLDFQFKAFNNEMKLFNYIRQSNSYDKYNYFPEVMIWNRSHLGEFVYSQMFREGDPSMLKSKLINYEKGFISHDVYLITLTADPNFFLSKEDGLSFSQTLEDKTRELELFKEAHEFSLIPNKLIIKVDKNGEFRKKHDILNEVIEFMKIKKIEKPQLSYVSALDIVRDELEPFVDTDDILYNGNPEYVYLEDDLLMTTLDKYELGTHLDKYLCKNIDGKVIDKWETIDDVVKDVVRFAK